MGLHLQRGPGLIPTLGALFLLPLEPFSHSVFLCGAGTRSWRPGTRTCPCSAAAALGSGPGLTPVQRFRGGLVFKAHRLLYHSTLGLRVIKKKRRHLLARRGGREDRVLDGPASGEKGSKGMD